MDASKAFRPKASARLSDFIPREIGSVGAADGGGGTAAAMETRAGAEGGGTAAASDTDAAAKDAARDTGAGAAGGATAAANDTCRPIPAGLAMLEEALLNGVGTPVLPSLGDLQLGTCASCDSRAATNAAV